MAVDLLSSVEKIRGLFRGCGDASAAVLFHYFDIQTNPFDVVGDLTALSNVPRLKLLQIGGFHEAGVLHDRI